MSSVKVMRETQWEKCDGLSEAWKFAIRVWTMSIFYN